MGRRGSGTVLALLGVLAAAPGAGAWEAEGSLVIETAASFPAGSRFGLPSAVAFLGDAREADALEVTAARVEVRVHEMRYLDAANLARVQQGEHRETSWESMNVRVRSTAGSDDGFAAFEADAGSAVEFSPRRRADAEHRSSTLIASDENAHAIDPTNPRHPFYWREFTGDHLYMEAPGTLEGTLGGALRVQGWTITLESGENATTLRTGEWSPRLGERVVRWAILTFEDATLRLDSPRAPVQVVAPEASAVAWSGAARVRVVDGALRTEGAEYASVGLVDLSGDLHASLFPIADGGSNLRLAAIRGDLASTTLVEHPRPAPPREGSSWLAGALAVAAAVATGGAAGALAARPPRLRPRPPPTREDQHAWCLAWAAWFEEQEDAAAALECLLCARAYADEPDHETLLWEGACLDRLGNLEEALAAFEAAVAVAPRGECEAAFSAAIVAGQLAREEPALLNLRLALMGDPFLVEVVDALASSEDDPFEALRDRPAFRQLVREARGWARAAGTR